MTGAPDKPTETISPPSMMDSPELFKAAVAAAVAAAAGEIRNSLMTDVAAALVAQKSGGDMGALVSDLTMAIASMTDTGDNRKKIAPDEAKRRVTAHGKMIEVLERIHSDSNLRPHYEVVAEMQLEEQLIQKFVTAGEGKWKQNEIIWRGVPNSAMRPKNAIAKEIFEHYLMSIGGTTANTAGLREQPTWVSYGGLQVVGEAPRSLANRGLAIEAAEPMELGADLRNPTREITSVDDPSATRIPVLGKTFAPATRADPSQPPSLMFPNS